MQIQQFTRLSLVAAVAVLLAAGLALAQAPPPSPPPAPQGTPPPGGAPPPPYDKATETTLKGPIEEVKIVQTPSGVRGTHLMMKDGAQRIEVFAGPTPFLERQGMTFAKGDAIEVTGSRVTVNGISALLPRQIKKGDKTFVLRDETGYPVWAPKRQG